MINKVELEITSNCNAACPGCARTLHKDLLQIKSFTLQDLQRIFPNDSYEGTEFKFCGVLGDPAANIECVDMVEYLLHKGAYCELSTNGGIQKPEWWARLGKLAKNFKDKVHVHFCLDGHEKTNHIYRVNTKFNIIKRNMEAYSWEAPPGHATWIYIIFDHNEDEIQIAEHHAKILGFDFAIRTGMRNSYHKWIAQIGKKNSKEIKKITTTGAKEHTKKDIVKSLDSFIKDYKINKTDVDKKKDILQSIVCKYIHENEIFIASDLTMWPCCFLWDSAFKNKEGIIDKLNAFEPNWNSLAYHSIEEIKNHIWFKEMLAASWDPAHNMHFSRCIRTCAKNKAYHNEINYSKG